MFLDYLRLLKKHKRDADRSKSLWSGTTPVPKLAYNRNCGQFCFVVSGRKGNIGVRGEKEKCEWEGEGESWREGVRIGGMEGV